MIVKSDRMAQDDEGTWWYQWPDNGHNAPVRGRCFIFQCHRCGETVVTYPSKKSSRFCGRSCSGAHPREAGEIRTERAVGLKGERSPRWSGGRRIARGYVLVYAPDHPSLKGKKRKYIGEHRLVMEQMLGRGLSSTERVHHKDGNKQNNDPSNLELWEVGHPAGQRVEDKMVSIPLSLLLLLLQR